MKIKKILQKASLELKEAGIPTSDLDARVLLEHSMAKDSVFLYSNPNGLLTNAEYAKFRSYIRKRKSGLPVAYIIGYKEFYGHDFIVNKNVLIPRPESEWLVEQALERIKGYVLSIKQENNDTKSLIPNTKYNILDLGTGSGCLIISIALDLSTNYQLLTTNYYASDISAKALSVAKKNSQRLLAPLLDKERSGEVNEIKFYKSDLFSNTRLHKRFNLIVANLPYVPLVSPPFQGGVRGGASEAKNPIDFEPANAIFAPDNGASIIKKFLQESTKYLAKDGTILIELDPRNALELEKFAKKIYKKVELKKDLARLNRYLIISKN